MRKSQPPQQLMACKPTKARTLTRSGLLCFHGHNCTSQVDLRAGLNRSYIYQTCTNLTALGEQSKGTCFVSFLPCTNCGQRERGKLAGLYAYWYESDEQRVAYRCRCCVDCLTTLMGSLKNGASADSSLLTVCPMCGSDSSQNLSGIFLTIYPPKQSEREYALTTCVSCAGQLQTFFVKGDKLSDRNGGAGAAAPAGNDSGWASIPW
jgi:hypothetical protein